MIHVLKELASSTQISEMLQEYDKMIKIVVDIRRRVLSGGGEMHSDCESVLLEDGSEQDDLWGQTGIRQNSASSSNRDQHSPAFRKQKCTDSR